MQCENSIWCSSKIVILMLKQDIFRKIAFKIAKPVAGGIQDEEAEKAREEEKKKDVVKLGAPVKKEQKRSKC